MATQAEILKKIEKAEDEQIFTTRAVKAGVCPKCGEDIKRNMDDHGFVSYNCTSKLCQFHIYAELLAR